MISSGEPETPGVKKIIFWKSRPFSGKSFACSAVNVPPSVSVVVSTIGSVSPDTSTFSDTCPVRNTTSTRFSAATFTATLLVTAV